MYSKREFSPSPWDCTFLSYFFLFFFFPTTTDFGFELEHSEGFSFVPIHKSLRFYRPDSRVGDRGSKSAWQPTRGSLVALGGFTSKKVADPPV